jgi:hypothetical protein
MQRAGFRVDDSRSVQLGLVMLAVWLVVGLTTIVAAANTLA